MNMTRSLRSVLATLLTSAVIAAPALQAQTTVTWISNNITGSWSATTNWVGGVAPTNNDVVAFAGLFVGNYVTTNDLTGLVLGTGSGVALSVTNGTNSTSWTLNGNALTLNGDFHSLTGTNSNTRTINVGLDLGSSDRTFQIAFAGPTIINGLVSGSGAGLTKTQTGVLTLSNNANSFTGGLFINGGTVEVTSLANSNSASAAGAGSFIGLGAGNNSGTLTIRDVPGAQGTDRQVFIGSDTAATNSGITATITSSGNSPVAFTNATFNVPQTLATVERILTIGGVTNSGVNEISGLIQDNNTAGGGTVRLTKSGGGTWTLTGTTNTFSGRVLVDNGTLIARTIANSNSASSLGQGTEIQLGNSGAGTLILTNSGAAQGTDRTFVIGPTNNATSTIGGTIRNENADAAHTLSFSNAAFNTAVAASNNRTLILRGANAGLNEITGVIQDNTGTGGTIGISKQDSGGTWYLGGTASTFSGLVNANGGSLLARTIANSNTASSLGQGALVQLSGGTLIFTNSGAALGTDRQVLIGQTNDATSAAGGTIQNANTDAAHTVTFSNAAFNAAVAASNNRTLTLRGANAGLNTISGVIQDNTGTGGTVAITKQDGGTWYLAATNSSFSGRLQLNAGSVLAATIANAGANSSLGKGADEIQLSGGTLGFTNSPASMGTDRKIFIGVTNNATSTAGAVLANANTTPSATVTFSNAVFNTPIAGVTTNRTLILEGQNTGTNTISGVIADNNTGGGGTVWVRKRDAGTWVLSNEANTFTGLSGNVDSFVVQDGTLVISKIANNGADSSLGKGTGFIRLGESNTTGALVISGSSGAMTTDRTFRLGGNAAGNTGSGTVKNDNANAAHTVQFTNAAFNATGQNNVDTDRTLTLGGINTGSNTITGTIANPGTNTGRINLAKVDAGRWILAGSNSYTGDTTVSGGTLELASTGQMRFVIGGNGTNNGLKGTGTVVLDGSFNLDLSGAATNAGSSWTIVAASLTETYGTNFLVTGFNGSIGTGLWTNTTNGVNYIFAQSNGILSVQSTGAPTPYNAWVTYWQGVNPGFTNTARSADPDGDTFDNNEEFAFDGNPSVGTPALLTATKSGTNAVFNYVALTNTNAAIYVVQRTTNLSSPGSWTNFTVTISNSTNQGGINLTNDYVRREFVVPATNNQFFRVQAAVAP